MQFNKYIWNLYKYSETGKKAIKSWIQIENPDVLYELKMTIGKSGLCKK